MTSSTESARLPSSAFHKRSTGLSVLAGARLAHLHWASRRSWFALGALAACGMALGAALHWHWDTYGALQLPLLFETGAAAIIAVAITSPFGEPERATGRWLPFLRLGLAMALSAAAVATLVAGGATAHLAGGTLDLLRNTAGLIGIALLFAAWLGGGLAGWARRLHGRWLLRPVQGLARADIDHTVDMAGPPAPRSRWRALRRPCLRRRHGRLALRGARDRSGEWFCGPPVSSP
jgi:hypothetical protein